MTTSKLLQLPKELRLHILEQLFADNEPVIIGLPSGMPWQGRPAKYHPPIAETCTLLRHEALPAYYQDRTVILLLRYREGRRQVIHWINHVLPDDRLSTRLTDVSLRYFEECHRSTSFHIDMRKLRILNKDSWTHPLSHQPLHLLYLMENALSQAQQEHESDQLITKTLRALIDTMLAPLEHSRVMRCESMANLRMHGYTDFQLRFEVISIIYWRPKPELASAA